MKKLIFLLIIFFYTSSTFRGLFAQIGSKVQVSKTSLAGNWSNNQFGFAMILQLDNNGSGTFDGEKITYTNTATTLSVKQDGEMTVYKYALQNGKLTLSGGDLDTPITFSKGGGTSNAPTQANTSPTSQKSSNATNSNLLGTWSVNGETVVFNADKTGSYNGNRFNYIINGNTLTTSDNTGTTVFNYSVNGNNLTLIGGGVNVIMQRGAANTNTSQSNTYSKNTGGGIDQSIVGKWCWVNASSTYTSSSSSSKCIVLNENGSYEYYAEGSISGYGGGGYGGSASQSADRGTWKLEGNRIHVQSQAQGYKVYSFEKRNHPKNGDPMIVIDGDTYVTFYQKAPWR
jgi:hypothetical protein